MITVPTREHLLGFVLKRSRVAELGVFRGDFARAILDRCEPTELHLFDRWAGRAECGDKDGEHVEVVDSMEEVYRDLRQDLGHVSAVAFHRGEIQDELARMPDDYFDFVYVDADHSEHATYADLVLAQQKSLGLIGGHDLCPRFPGVERAVLRFLNTNPGWQLLCMTADKCPSYLLGQPS